MKKETIESAGWAFKFTNNRTYWFRKEAGSFDKAREYYGYPIYGMMLLWSPENNGVKIYFNFTSVTDEVSQENEDKMFEGEISSVEDFNLITRLLKIN